MLEAQMEGTVLPSAGKIQDVCPWDGKCRYHCPRLWSNQQLFLFS